MNKAASQKLEAFFDQTSTLHYKKTETFLRAGDLPQGVYFLKKGYVRLYSLSEEGKELTLVIYKPGDFFPVVWAFFGKSPSSYYFETLTPVVVARTTRELFLEFISSNPDVFLHVTNHIIRRFTITLRRMEYLTFGNVSQRLASILLTCAQEYGKKGKGEVEIQIPFTHEDLANLLGVARETISLEIKKFERNRLIKYRRKLIVIKNKAGLEKEAILP